MRATMHRGRAVLAAACACATSLAAASALALEPTQERIGPARDQPGIELQMRAHEQRMLRDQEEHRLNLETDRDAMRYRPPEMRIPSMQPKCRPELRGNRWITSCG